MLFDHNDDGCDDDDGAQTASGIEKTWTAVCRAPHSDKRNVLTLKIRNLVLIQTYSAFNMNLLSIHCEASVVIEPKECIKL